MTEPTRPCGTCGMPCTSGEYHPYAACLMFKACHNSETVRANLEAVRATQAQAGAVPPIEWPKTRDVGRIGDMSPSNSLRVGLDSDNDAYVSVCGEDGIGSVEFCAPGAGGGKSSRTRLALIALMVAIEADNAEDPRMDWWARRMGGIKGGQHG